MLGGPSNPWQGSAVETKWAKSSVGPAMGGAVGRAPVRDEAG